MNDESVLYAIRKQWNVFIQYVQNFFLTIKNLLFSQCFFNPQPPIGVRKIASLILLQFIAT